MQENSPYFPRFTLSPKSCLIQLNFPSFPNTCYSHSKTPKFNIYNRKVAKCLHLINFQDAAEPFLKRPLELEARELFEIYMSNFIDDWVEIPNHHKVPVPTKPSELLFSTFHLVNTSKWTPSCNIFNHPRKGLPAIRTVLHGIYAARRPLSIFCRVSH
jgi:hypothetical protein